MEYYTSFLINVYGTSPGCCGVMGVRFTLLPETIRIPDTIDEK